MTIMKYLEDFLSEASLGRVWQHMKSNRAVVILTAFRGERPEKDNIKLNKELASKVRAAGWGFFWVDGVWIENEGTPKENHVSEVSLFVIGDETDDLRANAVKWAKDYNQDAVAYKPAGKNQVEIVNKQGKTEFTLTNVKLDKMSEIYTRIRRGKKSGGRTFVFESVRSPLTWIGRLQAKHKGIDLDNVCI